MMKQLVVALALAVSTAAFAEDAKTDDKYVVKKVGPNYQVVNTTTGGASGNEYASETAAKKEAAKQNKEQKKIDKSLNK